MKKNSIESIEKDMKKCFLNQSKIVIIDNIMPLSKNTRDFNGNWKNLNKFAKSVQINLIPHKTTLKNLNKIIFLKACNGN